MAARLQSMSRQNRVTTAELEQFIVDNVQPTGVDIGVGAYGSVEEVEMPGARVAAKKLHPQLISLGSPEQVHKWISDFVAECRLMSLLRHPHVVQFLGVCYLPGSQLPVLLMEKLQTSLDHLLETNPQIPIHIKVHLLSGTDQGVVYLHGHTPPISHRDLTARNILIDSGLTAKIADLGMAKIVTIQPGNLAATMTRAPGNILYMPPEAVQEERATRYNTAIDIFSFGVISLFTLTQTFPKDLQPATYFDASTHKLVARSEIERRQEYIQLMTAALGGTHPLVQLTLNCLQYLPGDRPSAVEVLTHLEGFRKTIPQDCTESKLELIRQIVVKEREIQFYRRQLSERTAKAAQGEHQRQNEVTQTDVSVKQAQIEHLQATNDRLQAANDQLQNEKREQIRKYEQQLEVQRREIDHLSGQLRSLELGGRAQKVPSQTSHQDPIQVAPTRPNLLKQPRPRSMVPSSITFNWRRCKDIPKRVTVLGLPITHDGKLYIVGSSGQTRTIIEYTPALDEWGELPPPPATDLTVASLRGHLIVMGKEDQSTLKTTNTIFTFDSSQRWVQSHSGVSKGTKYHSAIIGYQEHLIVAGGRYADSSWVPDVDILDTTSNKWITAESLPATDSYRPILIEDTMYLIGRVAKHVLRANIPLLISKAKSGVWELLPEAPFYDALPINIDNFLLTVGGRISRERYSSTSSIQLYDPSNNCWTRVGELPEQMESCNCAELSGQLFVLGGSRKFLDFVKYVYVAELTVIF